MRTWRYLLTMFLVFLTANCARVVVKTDLTVSSSETRWVNKTLGKMSIEEKIGQMICCSYSGRFLNIESDSYRKLVRLIRDQMIGGLILFGGEVYETAYLTNTLQKLAKFPLLIASDLERGLGNQISGATLFPPLMSIGAANSEELAYLMGKTTAHEARALGIHMTYAPVVDVNINPDNPIINTRSVGEDPEAVSRLSIAFIKGCQENGLIATSKHFPGHGDTDLDSHSVLATIEGDRNRLEEIELYPFKKTVESGVLAIMTAHLHIPALDPTPDLPATLSRPILTDLLRKEFGFQGIIVTDSMGMGGITTLYSPEEAALKAVQAGVDMVLLPPKPKGVINTLVNAVKRGNIPESRINDSVRRILEAKARLGLHKYSLIDIEDLNKKVATKAHLLQAARTFESSMTLVRNEQNVIPLSLGKKKIAAFSLSSDPGSYFAGRPFIQEIIKRAPNALTFFADAFTGEEFIQKALLKAKDADVFVIALFSRLRAGKGNVDLNERHIQLIKDAAKGQVPVVVVSFGTPYFLRHFPEIDAYMCAYRYAAEAQLASVKALFGEIKITGKLPVSIPDLYPLGHGINITKKEKN